MTARVASPNSGRTVTRSGRRRAGRDDRGPERPARSRRSATVSVPVTLAAGTHTLKLAFTGDGQNLDWIAFAPCGDDADADPTPHADRPAAARASSPCPTTAPNGSAVKFTVTPAAGKSIGAAWWSFDATAHLNTWNSRAINPTFYYPAAGTFTPAREGHLHGRLERDRPAANYIRAT